jgi:hypothetical protein
MPRVSVAAVYSALRSPSRSSIHQSGSLLTRTNTWDCGCSIEGRDLRGTCVFTPCGEHKEIFGIADDGTDPKDG